MADIITHGLVGRLLASNQTKKEKWAGTIGGMFPDLFQIPLYLYVGYIHNRIWPINADWDGFRDVHPCWSMLWEIPHSMFILILALLVYAIRRKSRSNTYVFFWVGYTSHLFIDVFTHSGEWSMKPFFPLQISFNGYSDMWAWNPLAYLIPWTLLIAAIYLLERCSPSKR